MSEKKDKKCQKQTTKNYFLSNVALISRETKHDRDKRISPVERWGQSDQL